MNIFKSTTVRSSAFLFCLLATTIAIFGERSFAAGDCTNCAKNRIEVLTRFDRLRSTWVEAGASVWINANDPDPYVEVGDKVYFTMKSLNEAFFALILVDAKGHTSVLKPDGRAKSGYSDASTYAVFPPLSEKCFVYEPRQDCFVPNNSIVQGDTIGKETVYLLVSERAIDNQVFSLPNGADYVSLGKDLGAIDRMVQRLESEFAGNRIDVYKYAYSVESPDVQYATRAIGRIVVDLEGLASNKTDNEVAKEDAPVIEETPVQQELTVVEAEPEQTVQPDSPALVFNNIRFEYDSAEITVEGRREIAALGSVLVDRLELGKLPFVSLTGHTDSTGSASYNMDLSGRRANAVKQHLVVEWGLPASQIFADGAGESSPVAPNNTTSGRSQNRRVEFTVVSPAE